MPTFRYTATYTPKTVFKFPSSALPKRVRVDGFVVTPQSTTDSSVTLAPAPFPGATVEVIYGELRTVVDLAPGTPQRQEGGGVGMTKGGGLNVYGYFPAATVVNTAESIAPPVITFVGDTADNLLFAVDPAWAEASVNDRGQITASRKTST